MISNLDNIFHDCKDLLEKDTLTEDVYHYTNCYENIIDIMQRRQLIMCTHKPLDDGKDPEISYTFNALRRHPLWTTNLRYRFQSIPYLKTIGELFDYFLKKGNFRFFTTSFSLNRDDPKLWKEFGGAHSGFCLKISKDHFEHNPYHIWDPTKPFNATVRILYGTEALEKILNVYLEGINKLYNYRDVEQYLRELRILVTELTTRLTESLRAGFKYENEYRLFTMDIGPAPNQRISQDIIFSKNGAYALYNDKIHQKNLKEILIGSNNDFNQTRDKMLHDLSPYFSKEELSSIEIKCSEA